MRTLRMVGASLVATLSGVHLSHADVFADFGGDFSGTTFPTGWSYQWNAPADWTGTSSTDASTGAFGNPATYSDLQWNGSLWTADGDSNSGNGAPANFLRVNAAGGHPGRGSSQAEGIGNNQDRYVIAAYTIQPGDVPAGGGAAFITGSTAGVANAAGGIRVDTHIGAGALNPSVLVAGNSSSDFNQYAGHVNVGDTVYVGIGPNTHDGNDSFTVDFSLSNASSTALRMANYRNDYTTGTQPARWRYLWNAPTDWNGSSSSDGSTGNITTLSDYELLQAAGANWYVDGDTDSSNGSPGRFLQLNATGGHPGRADGQDEVPPLTVANGHDRYAIAAYDVPESGYYSIRDSFFDTLGPNGDGSDVRVYTNLDPANPVFDGSFDDVTAGSFDAAVGFLNPGDSIFVAVGTNGSDGVDGFAYDFSVYYSQVPEPGTGTLVILGGLLLRRLRRRA